MMFAAAFAHTLACWSSTSRFLLNVPLFGRQALHPDVDSLVGDFTSSLLLDIDLTGTADAASRAHGAGRHADRGGALQLSGPVGTARPGPLPRRAGAGPGGVHQRARTRRVVLRRRHRGIRHAELDHLAGAASVARRPGHRIRRRRHGELGRSRRRFPGRRHRRDVRSSRRRTATAGRRRRRAGTCPIRRRCRRTSAPCATGSTAEPPTPAERRCIDGFFRRAEQQPDAPAVFPDPAISPTASCGIRH